MLLDNPAAFPEIDTQNLIAEIDGLPDQLQAAWDLGQALPLPDWTGITRVVIAGMGSSALGGELLAAYAAPTCRVPIFIYRNYTLPEWVQGPETLVIASSHSGNTEETLSASEQAVGQGCRVLAICTGGRLAETAQLAGAAVWRFEHQSPLGAALGYSFGLPLVALFRLGLIPNPEADLASTVAELKRRQKLLRVEVGQNRNPAKRLAGQCYGRSVTVVAADHLVPVARRWKEHLNEFAKNWAQVEEIPEANHNTIAGVVNPVSGLQHTMVLVLRGRSNHPRNQTRLNITKEYFMLEGLGTDFVNAHGDTPLAEMWTLLHFGDYAAYYLALLYGVDPLPGEAIEGFKEYLNDFNE